MKYFLLVLMTLLSFNTLAVNKSVSFGSGKFTIAGGKGHSEKLIDIYYHLPTAYNEDTSVLIVLPGGGRNGWSYRDSWIEASEKYNVLILSPSYSDELYPRFWNYNIGRMLSDVKINKERTAIESYRVVSDPNEWIFNDFDRIFDDAINRFNLNAKQYDMFGHSAGGQILHRLALFDIDNKADRILSSNSGWYTVPTFEHDFPYGLNNGVSSKDSIRAAFTSKLTIFLGELDNQNETRGHLVRNPQVDTQGTYRLSRGKYFYQSAKTLASDLQASFNWDIHVVKGVGHDYKNMGKAAAVYLYAE
ncbi:hydrolase [Simiduia litorea]|uniref:hypothetical protein n=1 Tax=Simiduia litorea TaxID=1435348 RepID=UPI0036F28858